MPRDALVAVCDASGLDWRPYVDLAVAEREARRFKLDVSFALGPSPSARLSINDKGEPAAFRARLPAHPFFALSPPGEVQTTVGLKPGRFTYYYEELAGHPRAAALHAGVFALAGVDARWEGTPNAVAIDVDAAGRVLAAKDYTLVIEGPDDPTELPELPIHPVNRTRRTMRARRFAPGGRLLGTKTLWVSEVHRPEHVAPAWALVDRLVAQLAVDDTPLRRLRAAWRWAPDTFLYPDLVSVNRDAAGDPEALIVYVSAR